MRTFENVEQMTSQPSLRAPNYRVAQNCLAQLHPFKHSTMSASWGTVDGKHAYIVKSYQTEVAWVTRDSTEIEDNRWGVTTGKHLGYARRNLPETGWAERVR